MRAVLCSAFTGPEDLRIGEIEAPEPASDEILIDVYAASVSFMDHLLVSGRYQMRPSTPFVPGTEAAGIVIAVGLMPIGFTSGQIPSVPMNLPLLKNYSIVGVFTGAWAEKFPEQAARMNDTLAQLLAEGKIRPHIDRVLPLEQVKEAMRAVANRTVQGRIVLKIK